MELKLIFGAALLVLLFLLPALVPCNFTRYLFGDWAPKRRPWRARIRDLVVSELGVVVVTYTWPNGPLGGTITPPTGAQANQAPVQTAQVFFADTDTQAVVIHNSQMPASFPSQLYPLVLMTKSLGGASDSSFATNFTIGKTNTNSITINKIGVGTGSGGTYDVAMFFGDGPWQK